jgi:hypothetical protein
MGAVMPIYKLIQRGVFPPELVTMMVRSSKTY